MSRVVRSGWLVVFVPLASVAWLAASVDVSQAEEPETKAMQLFQQRIMPIFRSPEPSSCVQCHLSSVDIKDYILPSHRDTFLALRSRGLIDVEEPSRSKILTLIQMGEKDLDRGARMIHEKTRRAEYEAFSAWIEACCRDATLVSLPVSSNDDRVGPQRPIEVVRHARKSRIVESFSRNIWSQRMRCFPCHTPHEIDRENSNHQVPAERHAELVAKYGAKMNLFQKTPEETLSRLVAASRKTKGGNYPMLNLAEPTKSLLILKPTSKLPEKLADGSFAAPSSSGTVSHMGGLKMHVNDVSYKAFASWIADYAAVVGDDYRGVDELPQDNWVPTDRVVRLADVPSDWGELTTVQLFVHGKDRETGRWREDPLAFTQGLITPRRMVNGPLFLIRSSGLPVPDETAAAERASDGVLRTDGADEPFPLDPGTYLIRIFVDARHRIDNDPQLLLDQSDFVGEVEREAKWLAGFPNAEVVSAKSIHRPRD